MPGNLATEADIKQVLQVDDITPELVKENFDQLVEQLEDRGYYGFAIGHDVLIFKN